MVGILQGAPKLSPPGLPNPDGDKVIDMHVSEHLRAVRVEEAMTLPKVSSLIRSTSRGTATYTPHRPTLRPSTNSIPPIGCRSRSSRQTALTTQMGKLAYVNWG